MSSSGGRKLAEWEEERVRVWSECPSRGTTVHGTGFLPVKLPLSGAISGDVQSWTPSLLCGRMMDKQQALGLFIDATCDTLWHYSEK